MQMINDNLFLYEEIREIVFGAENPKAISSFFENFKESEDYSESLENKLLNYAFGRSIESKKSMFFVPILEKTTDIYVKNLLIKSALVGSASLGFEGWIDLVSSYWNKDCINADPYSKFLNIAVSQKNNSCLKKLISFASELEICEALFEAHKENNKEATDILYDHCSNVMCVISKIIFNDEIEKEDIYLYQKFNSININRNIFEAVNMTDKGENEDKKRKM